MALTVAAVMWIIVSYIYLTQFNPTTRDVMYSVYDYVIVGAGSGGSVLANRLSEDPCVRILLLEAGPEANRTTEIPGSSCTDIPVENVYPYKTVPQKRAALKLKDQRVNMPTGKGLGGTSLINGLLYVRGNRRDYDRWADEGATGWGWNDIYSYFLKSEDNTDPEFISNGHHGTGGPLTISTNSYQSTISTTFAKAGEELGYKYGDIHTGEQTGFYKIQATIRDGRRCSASKAFLVPAQERENLDIMDRAHVTKVLINEYREAFGVKFEREGAEYEVYAAKEVLVSAGAFDSPKLLMLSGIGPKAHLEQLGIPVVADLPVGNNLQDHLGNGLLEFEAVGARSYMDRFFTNISESISEYNSQGTGVFSNTCGIEGVAFVGTKFTDPELDWPDVQIHLIGYASTAYAPQHEYVPPSAAASERHTFRFLPAYLRPRSTGTVRLASADAKNPPLIDMNLFAFDEDIDKLTEALKVCINIVTNTRAFRDIGAKMSETKLPGCEAHELYSEEYLRCVAISYTSSVHHIAGTCKMGSPYDPSTVVDPRLKVIGIDRLRVVDASVMPHVVGGNTIAAVYMIGEKASDMIKEDNYGRKKCDL